MTFLEFNMKLNEIISAWLEDGGDPARCADALRMIANEVFEVPLTPEEERAQHEDTVRIDLLRHMLRDED
jgi:hypothetical protein